MTTFAAFALAGLMTYVLRSSMTLWGHHLLESPRMTEAIGLVAPAVLAAIVVSGLLLDGGTMTYPEPEEVLALGVGLGVVHRTGNVSLALLVGLPVFWLGSMLAL